MDISEIEEKMKICIIPKFLAVYIMPSGIKRKILQED